MSLLLKDYTEYTSSFQGNYGVAKVSHGWLVPSCDEPNLWYYMRDGLPDVVVQRIIKKNGYWGIHTERGLSNKIRAELSTLITEESQKIINGIPI
ncbi:MAG: hypothetical protein AAGC43_04595 [Bacteroidota bacterium]